MVDLGIKMILHDKVRSAITVLGVAFAVMLVLVQTGLLVGLLDNASVTIEQPRADLWVTSKNTPNVDFPHPFPETHVQRVRSIPGVARADNLIVVYVDMALPNGSQEALIVYGLEDFRAWSLPWEVVEGDPANLRRVGSFMLDESAARRFGPFALGERREILGQRLEIVGKTRGARSFTTTPMAFMDLRRAQALNPGQYDGQTNYVLIALEPGADPEAVRREVKARLPWNDVYTKAEWAARSRDYWVVNTGLGVNLFVTVFLGCLVGVVIVAQTLYTATLDHLREFGTVKAIGGTNLEIYALIGRQAALAAVVGFALGLIPSFGVGPLVALVDLQMRISPELVGATFLGTLGLCLGAAAFSFRKVAGIDPALVFRG